ncbi:peroxiredoxin family protein [Thalassotalea profundi]|uniref:Alkyl hydroperoxide reductase n=1 Tax=Thalassotalea profundi TaxID=2036687 RepID=A0ABQ3IC53_9GAMM|nr:peroxiredoxin family protein [Thalassotalea profundi]GHE77810.1 alkyl hydroperoxide reductase [Thalassotalea profundi]
MNNVYKNTIKSLTFTGLLLASVLNINIVAAEQQSLAIGPNAGEMAPAITVKNNQGNVETIESLSAEKGLIILFFRSADWCPFCKKHLIELNNEAQKFKDLGYGLAGISYDNSEVLTSFTQEQKISYPLLSDQQAKTMLSYDILNDEYKIGDRNYGIPYPGVVVIDKAGKITHKYFFHGYKKRVKFTELYSYLTTKM